MKLYKKIISYIIETLGYDITRLESGFLVTKKNTDEYEKNKSLYPYMLEQHLILLLKAYKVNCVLDVGANRGQYALKLRKLGYQGNIISFEPVKECFRVLKKLAQFDSKWFVYPFALGEKNFTTEIYVTNHTDFSSLLKANSKSIDLFGDISSVSSKEQIEVIRLDFALNKLVNDIEKPRYFLKIDTQGYDTQVFLGLGEYIKNVVGLQSEVSVIPIYEGMVPMSEAVSLYESHGFEITGLFPVSIDKLTFRVVEFDCIMVRKAALKNHEVNSFSPREIRSG